MRVKHISWFLSSIQSFIDHFDRADGALGNNWSYVGAWNIVSGKLVGSPAVTGSNLLVNGDFETGNPPTGWSPSASNSIAQDADTRPSSLGTKSGKITVGGSAYAVSRAMSAVFVAGRCYQIKYWGKTGTNTQFGVGVFEQIYENDSAWAQKMYGRIASAASSTANLLGNTGTFFLDDIEVKQLVTSHLFAVREFNQSDVDISVTINRTGKDYGGIVLCVDDSTTPTDYITIGIDSYDISAVSKIYTIRVCKVVGGVFTLLQNMGLPFTYADGSILRVIKNGAAIKMYFEGKEFSEDVFVSDAGIVNNTKHGLFSIGDSISFDDFQYSRYGSGVDRTPVFTRISQTTLWSTSGAKDWLGWPQLRKTGTTWIMTYVASTGHTDPDLTTIIHIRFSNDEGATWTNEDTKLGGGAVTGFPMLAHNPLLRTLGGILIVCPNGDLLFHQYDNTAGSFQWRSVDGGGTWVDEGLILDSRFISLDDYQIDGTDIYITINYTNNSGEPWINRLYKSTNNGTTWTMVSGFETNGDESGLVIAPNGNFIIVMRDVNKLVTYQFVSTDRGLTWGTKTVRPELYILQRPRMSLDGSGGIILHGRNYIDDNLQTNILYYSNDNGVTWGRRFMPDTTLVSDGNYNGYIIKGDGTYYMVTYSGTKTVAGIKQLIFSKS
jgi:hypothetical protein